MCHLKFKLNTQNRIIQTHSLKFEIYTPPLTPDAVETNEKSDTPSFYDASFLNKKNLNTCPSAIQMI